MSLLLHILKKKLYQGSLPSDDSITVFYMFIAMKKTVVKNVIGQSLPMNAYLHGISYIYI